MLHIPYYCAYRYHMNLFLYSQVLKTKDIEYVQPLLDAAFAQSKQVYIYEPYYQQLVAAGVRLSAVPQVLTTHAELLQANIDFAITLGGDGTMLHAIMLIRDSGIPILGINLGRLGFLAVADKRMATMALDCLFSGSYSLDPRRLIQLESNLPLFEDFNFALNDLTIVKRDTSSMIIVHAYLNGAFLNSYWADGLIVSTPSGSTGYSLSCGGPIIFPQSGNFVITPIAPHNLNVRPIVIPDSSTLLFEIEGRADNFLCTLDSRFAPVTAQHKLTVRCADFRINMVRIGEYSFLSTIRTKLSWGLDSRN